MELRDDLKIPSTIAKATDIRISHVSRTLKGLKEIKLVECLNEEANQGRIYTITEKGKEVLKYTKKI
ncbi:MAG: MarR family transcriptional regulator [Methanobacteriaceae archaeon]